MNLLFGNWIIKIIGKASKSDLDRILIRNSVAIILGDESYWEEIFLLYVSSTDGTSQFWIAVYSESSTTPSVIYREGGDCIVIGYNHEIAVIDLNIPEIIIEKQLHGYFHYAKYIENMLIILSEVCILILNNEYQEIFNQPTDVIESFKFSDKLLEYKTHSGQQTFDTSKHVEDASL